MNLLIAGQSGWGKSYLSQSVVEKNAGDVDYLVVLDYDDEYRGLVEGFEDIKWHPAGPKELSVSGEEWADRLEKVPKVVIPRYQLSDDEWQIVCANIALAARAIYSRTEGSAKVLVLIDEAHAVAPERKAYPAPIKKLAVAGRGEMVSCIWVTQRLAMVSKNITSQCTARYLGAFMDSNDLDSLTIEYPEDVHNPTLKHVHGCPPELRAEGTGAIPVRKWTDANGDVIGSEWIYSDGSGEWRRKSTKDMDMRTTHYGEQGYTLNL